MVAVDQNGNLNFRKSGSFGQFLTAAALSWNAPTLLNSWVNFGAPWAVAAYAIDSNGIVTIRGNIKNGTTTNGTTVLTLPSGYRPPATLEFAISARDAGGAIPTPAVILITSAGDVNVYGLASSALVALSARFSIT
jgi:hypothetical protein